MHHVVQVVLEAAHIIQRAGRDGSVGVLYQQKGSSRLVSNVFFFNSTFVSGHPNRQKQQQQPVGANWVLVLRPRPLPTSFSSREEDWK